jgi:hypothetical protein
MKGHSIAFAYKQPGPIMRGALDELMLAMCQGPGLPDAVVVIGLDEEQKIDLLGQLKAAPSKVAQERIKGRIPLFFCSLNLAKGTSSVTLLDSSFKNRQAPFRAVLEKDASAWLVSGLHAVFDPNEVVLRAPAGYAYQKPSGSRDTLFLKPDLALKSSAIVSFVALVLFYKQFAGRTQRFAELQTVFVDTMAIATVAYALRELLLLCGSTQPFHIESFHSYGGFDKVRRPMRDTSLCLISASTSMSLHEKWIAKKEVAVDEVVTLLTLKAATRHQSGALLALDIPRGEPSAGPPQLSIRIKGENFLPEQEPSKKVLLTDLHHRSDDEVAQFCEFAGQQIFDIYRRPARSGSRPRALYVNGRKLIDHQNFKSWLTGRLLHSVKAATQVVVFQNDEPSKVLANQVSAFCADELRLSVSTLSSSQLTTRRLPSTAGVVICAAVVGKGSQLLEISRTLRDKHDGPRLYVVGFQVAESRSELTSLDANLRHSKSVPYEIAKFGKAAIGTQMEESFSSEVSRYYAASAVLRSLPPLLQKRGRILGSTGNLHELALLPHGSEVENPMRLRSGFAYWPENFQPQPCHAEVLATIAVILQRAREHDKLPEERRLSSSSFRHVVLAPENFARFNDGVIQAALLRCAYPSELDYRDDHAASDFMKSVVLRALSRATQESGEAILEFLLALALGRLQLADAHLQEIRAALTDSTTLPSSFQRAAKFVLGRKNGTASPLRSKLPF